MPFDFSTDDPATGKRIADLVAKLRPYQITGLRISKDLFFRRDRPCRRQLLVNPTGTGKTVFFSTIMEHHGFKKRMLVLVHRDELATQARDKILAWNKGITVGIEKGKLRARKNDRVVVASVQTIGRGKKVKENNKVTILANDRLKSLNPEEFDILVIDEGHHAIATSYKIILRHFGFLDENFKKTRTAPQRLLLGVTATPKRCDNERLDQVFDKKIYEYPIDAAIREGWLVDPHCWRISTQATLDGVRTFGHDYVTSDLAKAVNTPARNRLIVQEWNKLAKDRPTVCFAVDIAHTKALIQEFRNYGVKADGIWNGDKERKSKLEAFARGEVLVIVNCEILTEGFDERSVSCIVLARPTQSESLFKQMVGRGMRTEDGINNILEALIQGKTVRKRDCLVLDVADLTTRHSLLVNFASAYDLPPKMDLKGKGLLEAHDRVEKLKEQLLKNPEETIDLSEVTDLSDLNDYEQALIPFAERVDLLHVDFDEEVLAHSQLQWHKVGREYFVLPLPTKGGEFFVFRNVDGFIVVECTVSDKEFTQVGTRPHAEFRDVFKWADAKIATVLNPAEMSLCYRDNNAKWRKEPASDAQINTLVPSFRSRGMQVPPGLTKGEANVIITKLKLMSTQAAKPTPSATQ